MLPAALRPSRHHWLAAEAGAVGAVPVEGVVVCGIGSAGRFSQPAKPVKAASNNTGIATLRIVMVQLLSVKWARPGQPCVRAHHGQALCPSRVTPARGLPFFTP